VNGYLKSIKKYGNHQLFIVPYAAHDIVQQALLFTGSLDAKA